MKKTSVIAKRVKLSKETKKVAITVEFFTCSTIVSLTEGEFLNQQYAF